MISKTERAYFRAAKAVSELSDHRQPLGCVVVNKHRIVSSGTNSHVKCHKVQALIDSERYGVECPGRVHAETAALLPLMRNGVDLSNATLYVHRQHKDGSIAMARPCEGCMQLIRQCGIKRIRYTTDSGYAREDLEL
jgi:deoxycytidylate deaminase